MKIFVAELQYDMDKKRLCQRRYTFEETSLYVWFWKAARSAARQHWTYESDEEIAYLQDIGLAKMGLYGLNSLFDKELLEKHGGLREHLANGHSLDTYFPCSEDEFPSFIEKHIYTEGGAFASDTSIFVATDNDEWPIFWGLNTSKAALNAQMKDAKENYPY